MNQLDSIITQLEQQRAAIDSALAALHAVGGQEVAAPAYTGKRRGRKPGKKRSMSDEGRQRQIEAMRRYWAAKKSGKKFVSKRK